jgi:hypothetical protein
LDEKTKRDKSTWVQAEAVLLRGKALKPNAQGDIIIIDARKSLLLSP